MGKRRPVPSALGGFANTRCFPPEIWLAEIIRALAAAERSGRDRRFAFAELELELPAVGVLSISSSGGAGI